MQLEILKTEGLDLKIGHWECRIENLDFERYLKTLKKIFFFWVNWVNSVWLSWLSFGWVKCGGRNFGSPLLCLFPFSFLLHLPSTLLAPLTLFTFSFPLIFLLHLTISSYKKHFSKLIDLPSSIYISLDPCVLSFFITHPFLVKPIFFASKWLLPPRGLLFFLFMVRNMIQHLSGMMMMDFFKTLGPMLHIVM